MSQSTPDPRMNELAANIDDLTTWWMAAGTHREDLPAIVAYLSGAVPADLFLAAWDAQRPARRYDLLGSFSRFLEGPRAPLSLIDERSLDLCAVALPSQGPRWLEDYFYCIGEQGPVAEAWDYLLKIGVDEAAIRQAVLDALARPLGRWREAMLSGQQWQYCWYFYHKRGAPPGPVPSASPRDEMEALWELAAARWRPEHLRTDLAPILAKRAQWDTDRELAALALLTLRPDPPAVEFAWQVAQIPSTYAGYLAGLLLAHDPARFTEWTCTLALDPGTVFAAGWPCQNIYAGREVRIDALRALARVDPARHMPFIEGLIPDQWDACADWMQDDVALVALELAYEHDPTRHQARVETILGDKALVFYRWAHALGWLRSLPEERGLPLIEYAIWHGTSAFARAALDTMLRLAGDRATGFAATLLAHPSKQIRAQATTWLIERGDSARAAVTPLLDARKPAARQATQDLLARLDARAGAAHG